MLQPSAACNRQAGVQQSCVDPLQGSCITSPRATPRTTVRRPCCTTMVFRTLLTVQALQSRQQVHDHHDTPGWQGHHEIWKYCQSTRKALAKVLQSLIVRDLQTDITGPGMGMGMRPSTRCMRRADTLHTMSDMHRMQEMFCSSHRVRVSSHALSRSKFFLQVLRVQHVLRCIRPELQQFKNDASQELWEGRA